MTTALNIPKKMQKLIAALQADKNFQDICDYTFQTVRICNMPSGQSINSGFGFQDIFIYNLCQEISSFPKSLFTNAMPLTAKEVAACKNYIIDILFLTICIDQFLDKYKRDIIACQNNFQNFAITDMTNAFMKPDKISFNMVERRLPHYIQVVILLPVFKPDEYATFDSIKAFLNTDEKIFVDIKPIDRNCKTHYSFHPIKEFKQFPRLLAENLKKYKMENNL